MKVLKPEERLIVAADFKPDTEKKQGRAWVRAKVLGFCAELEGLGVCIKLNSALRACGYGLLDEVHALGLKTFADLKFFDIEETLAIDGLLLREAKPALVTVACPAGVAAMKRLKAALPETEVLGVAALTTLSNEDTMAMFTCSTEEALLRFARIAGEAKLDGLISSAKEVPALRSEFGTLFTLSTPAIRPLWSLVPGDDQNPERVMTPEKAMKAGVDRMVVGRPITQAKNRREAALRVIEEIAQAA